MGHDFPFPLYRIPDIVATPRDFNLLQRVPTSFSRALVGDELPLVILDTETTGKTDADEIVELGLVHLSYSPSTKEITSINMARSWYREPTVPIHPKARRTHGIKDEDLAGAHIPFDEVLGWFEDDPLVVAHHAEFDRGKFDRLFPLLCDLRWACSCNEIDWKSLGMGSKHLEYLLFKYGRFYSAHRAAGDCVALGWLLFRESSGFAELLDSAARTTCNVTALGKTYPVKDTLKEWGFGYSGGAWNTSCSEEELPGILEKLDGLRYRERDTAVRKMTARERYSPIKPKSPGPRTEGHLSKAAGQIELDL